MSNYWPWPARLFPSKTHSTACLNTALRMLVAMRAISPWVAQRNQYCANRAMAWSMPKTRSLNTLPPSGTASICKRCLLLCAKFAAVWILCRCPAPPEFLAPAPALLKSSYWRRTPHPNGLPWTPWPTLSPALNTIWSDWAVVAVKRKSTYSSLWRKKVLPPWVMPSPKSVILSAMNSPPLPWKAYRPAVKLVRQKLS